MRTPFEQSNADFSSRAHEAAKQKINPMLFDVPPGELAFESTLLGTGARNDILDGEMAVDRLVKVSVPGLAAPLTFTVQERFRRPQFAQFRDLTITEWNALSRTPSELYKLNAGIFLYGYYDERTGDFPEALAISTTDLLLAVSRGQIPYTTENNRKAQRFLCFTFRRLIECGVVLFHYSPAMQGSFA